MLSWWREDKWLVYIHTSKKKKSRTVGRVKFHLSRLFFSTSKSQRLKMTKVYFLLTSWSSVGQLALWCGFPLSRDQAPVLSSFYNFIISESLLLAMKQRHHGAGIPSNDSWTRSDMSLLLTLPLTTTQVHVPKLIKRKSGKYFLATRLGLSHDVVNTHSDMIFAASFATCVCVYTNTKKEVWTDLH